MVELEIDGQKVEVLEGSMVMDAANKLGLYVPHFCYHKKLSIAANCRMCLVQVEKAPKPLPACATPVTAGMKVFTASDAAKKAQAGVMEFLLINHPLDCPICDQGGECQLQDLAVGYGGSGSRYQEEKRVVFHKNVGPLISMEEMTRCIHCTRCVRFGQEIAGVMELGMLGRGEHSEITSFVGKTVDSELSGNMIDICPVGALTSKPFRYSARTWELSRRKSVSPHDSLGANLVVQVKNNKVMRVVPLENEAINECWITDKDRFSYEALNSDQRLTTPMIKQGGEWKTADWQTALEYVAHGLTDIKSKHGAAAIGTLVSPHATLEEMHLAQHLTRALGSENIDHRLRQSDFSGDHAMSGAPWLGMPVAEVPELDRVLVVGSFFRKDHPLLASRVRQLAKKKGRQVSMIHSVDDDWLMNIANKLIVSPAQICAALDGVLTALGDGAADDAAKAIAASLKGGGNVALWIGNLAAQSADAAQIHARVQAIAHRLGELKVDAKVRVGFLGEAANSVGGHIARVVPGEGGKNARAMFEQPLKAYVLLHAEPAFDTAYPAQALKALADAEMVVVMSSFKHSMDVADVLLPIAPFTETAGTFINTEGRAQTFNGVVRPLGDTRPGWKVLRVLGNLLGLSSFEQDTPEAVRTECLPADIASKLNNHTQVPVQVVASPGAGYQRIADVPIYFADALARRAESLQMTSDAKAPRAWLRGDELQKLGIAEGGQVKLRNGAGDVTLAAARDDRLPAGCVRVAGGHISTINAGPLAGVLSVERA